MRELGEVQQSINGSCADLGRMVIAYPTRAQHRSTGRTRAVKAIEQRLEAFKRSSAESGGCEQDQND
jgi:hypothetical protein